MVCVNPSIYNTHSYVLSSPVHETCIDFDLKIPEMGKSVVECRVKLYRYDLGTVEKIHRESLR